MNRLKKLRIIVLTLLILMVSGLVLGYVSSEFNSKSLDYFSKYMDAEIDSDLETYYLEKSDDYSDLEDFVQTINTFVVYAILVLIIVTFIWIMVVKEIK